MLATGPFQHPLPPPPLPSSEGHNVTHNLPADTLGGSSVNPAFAHGDDHEKQRKRTYLELLPTEQIITICLTFEQHVSVHVRASVWPVDLEAAILALKTTSASSSTEQSKQDLQPSSEGTSVPASIESGTDSSSTVNETENLQPAAESSTSQPTLPSPSTSSQHPENSGDSYPQIDPHLRNSSQQPSQAPEATETQAKSSSTPAPAPVPTPAPTPGYPYSPYGQPAPQHTGYPPQHPQASYPHAPYYGTPGHQATPPGYPAPYPGYPPYPPPPGYPQHPHSHPPPPPPPPPTEDLPSYEDMIVEALIEIADPEGAAPKDLFTWMAARWPLQTNFRPSASQALQKAFKRGRLEKRSGGKYRLNPSWEGGATSKRTTRRPQTLAQTTYAMHHPSPSQTSPFTHAPLPHRAHTSPPPGSTQHQPYPGYPYPYPPPPGYSAYPGYPSYPPPTTAVPPTSANTTASTITNAASTVAAKTTVSAKTTVGHKTIGTKTIGYKTVGSKTVSGGIETGDDDASDAWEAAQHILQAINFGSLRDDTAQISSETNERILNTSGISHMVIDPALTGSVVSEGQPRVSLTDEERASLQAQLALLAAQLNEIAGLEDDDEEEEEGTEIQENIDQLSNEQQLKDAVNRVLMDINQFPEPFQIQHTSHSFQKPQSEPPQFAQHQEPLSPSHTHQFSSHPTSIFTTPPASSITSAEPAMGSLQPPQAYPLPAPPQEVTASSPARGSTTVSKHSTPTRTTPHPPPIMAFDVGPILATSTSEILGGREEEEEDEDEDMEMVDVDTVMREQAQGVRT